MIQALKDFKETIENAISAGKLKSEKLVKSSREDLEKTIEESRIASVARDKRTKDLKASLSPEELEAYEKRNKELQKLLNRNNQ